MIYAGRPFILDEWIQTNIDGSDIVGSVEVCLLMIFRFSFMTNKLIAYVDINDI